jgi:hypothetical protein
MLATGAPQDLHQPPPEAAQGGRALVKKLTKEERRLQVAAWLLTDSDANPHAQVSQPVQRMF